MKYPKFDRCPVIAALELPAMHKWWLWYFYVRDGSAVPKEGLGKLVERTKREIDYAEHGLHPLQFS